MTAKDLLRTAAAVRAAAAKGSLRKRRQAANVSLPELARALHVSVPALSRWERGRARPTIEHALLWGEALDALAQGGEHTATGARR